MTTTDTTHQPPKNGDPITTYTDAVNLPDKTILSGRDGCAWVLTPAIPPNTPRTLHTGVKRPITLDDAPDSIALFNEIAPFEILHIPL